MWQPLIINRHGKLVDRSRVRRSLPYQGIARRALVTTPLQQGALPFYDRDIDVSAVFLQKPIGFKHSHLFINKNGKIRDSPIVSISNVKSRRFNVIDRNDI